MQKFIFDLTQINRILLTTTILETSLDSHIIL